ncbi:MAG TPA: SRPBCC family protein [Gaiellaceae bacterium]|nr:SRPBCC family protein [Gaiellaceae bacterium]
MTRDTLIDRSPAEVWPVVVDLESHPRWRPALKEFRQVSEGPLGVGSRIHEVLAWRGREIVLADEVIALDPEQRLAIRGGWPAATFELDILLEPRGHATAVTFDWTLQPKSLLMRAAAPFLRGTFDRATAEELEGLKRYVGARTGVPGDSQA